MQKYSKITLNAKTTKIAKNANIGKNAKVTNRKIFNNPGKDTEIKASRSLSKPRKIVGR